MLAGLPRAGESVEGSQGTIYVPRNPTMAEPQKASGSDPMGDKTWTMVMTSCEQICGVGESCSTDSSHTQP